jgi:hypothetical protein
MEFEVQIAHSVAEVGPERWNELAQGRAWASYRWYQYGEKVLAGDVPLYVILSQQGRPVARATFWLTHQRPAEPAAATDGVMDAIIGRWPLCLCRSPLSESSGLILPPPPLDEAALATIIEVALEQARQHKSSFLIFDYLSSGEVGLASWPGHFALATNDQPGTRLEICWPDWESYLRQRLSRMGRKSYRQNSKDAAATGAVIRRYPAVVDVERAMALLQNVYDHYQTRVEPWKQRALEYATMVEGTWITAEIEGQIVGCELMVADGDSRLLMALGLEYSVPYLYFQLFYEDIRLAIEQGAQLLRAGSTAYEVKERMGFEREDNGYSLVVVNNRPLNHLFHWLGPQLGDVKPLQKVRAA